MERKRLKGSSSSTMNYTLLGGVFKWVNDIAASGG